MRNAGVYKHKIVIYKTETVEDEYGFQKKVKTIVLEPHANVKTTRGMTIIANNSDFEKAYTNFTIRWPKTVLDRDMLIDFNNKTYTIEYLSNINEENREMEIQAKEVTH